MGTAVLAVVGSSLQHLNAPRSSPDRSTRARQPGVVLGAGVILDTRGLLLYPRDAFCPRPGGISPCSCSLCPGHCCQTAWPLRPGDLVVAWGGCHTLSTGTRVALQDAVSPQRVREWAQARWDGLSLSPWPLPPCSGFAQCKDPRLGGPTTLTSKSVAVSPFTDSSRPISFPSPWGLGWLLPGFRCWSQGGQHEI